MFTNGPLCVIQVGSILNNIVAESPYTLAAGANLRPTLEISCLWRVDWINVGKSDVRITRTPLVARTHYPLGGAASCAAQALADFNGYINYNFDTLPVGYFAWPQSSFLENRAFWSFYKPRKQTTKTLKVGKSVSFFNKCYRTMISYEELASASLGFTQADGFIRNKSTVNCWELVGQLGQVCQDEAGAHSTVQEAPFQVLVRQQARFVYRWTNYNRNSIYGNPQYPYNVLTATSTVGVPQVKAYQTAANTAGGAMDFDKRQSVNIQPSFGCDGAAMVPNVRVIP